ncbi:MAG: hypothetical protein Fur009_1170 [Candidatus Microgenomates bacterium]
MKYKLILLLLLFGVLIIFFKNKYFKSSNFYQFRIDDKTYNLLTAKNQDEWEKGLMFYKNKKELNGADGMIFIFPDKKIRYFWNKNTYLDLDVYWLADEKIIGKDYLPSVLKTKNPYVISSKEKVNKVVEIIK